MFESINKKHIYLFFSGLMCSFAFAPFYLFFLFFIGFNTLLSKLKVVVSFRKAFNIGWLWGLGYFLGCCYWLVSPLTFEFPKYIILIPFAIAIIPAILAIYTGLLGSVFCFIKKEFLITNKFYLSIIFALLWLLMEFLRSTIIIPFPWDLIAYTTGFCRLLFQNVYIIGTFGLCLLMAFLYTALFTLKDKKCSKYKYVYIAIFVLIIGYGLIRFRQEKREGSYVATYNTNVRIIQPNFSQSEKRDDHEMFAMYNKLIELINKDSEKIDVVVLPETTIPYILYNYDGEFIYDMQSKINNKNLLIISGILSVEDRKIYNSLFVFKNSEIIDNYDKHFLAPFGEYIPLKKYFPRFLDTFIGIDFSVGETRQKLISGIKNFPDFSPIICYESLFNNAINKDAKLIINATNDIWFGKTTATFQHFDALRFRAVENGVPAIRSANSGISAYINKYGKVIKKTKLNKVELLDILL